MEDKKNNQATSFLMVVGIIFIVIAGTIFVSTTWGYLPEFAKLIILLLVGAGLHSGAYKLRERDMLRKTETAAYYLGSAFLGFAAYMGFKHQAVAGMVALIPVAIRFMKKKNPLDFVMTALLADWVSLWFQMKSDFGCVGICTIASCVLGIYTLLDVYRSRWQGNRRSVEVVFQVFYILHIVGYVIRSLFILLIGPFLTDSSFEYEFTLVIMAAFIVFITTVHYVDRHSTVIRIFQSLAIFWLPIITTIFVAENIITEMTFGIGFLLVFVTWAVCLAVVLRTEMFWIVFSTGLFIPLMKVIEYDLNGNTAILGPVVYTVLIFSFLVSVAIYLYRLMNEKNVPIRTFDMMMAGISQLAAFVIVMASSSATNSGLLAWSIITLQLLTVGLILSDKVAKKVLYCIALMSAELTAVAFIDEYVDRQFVVVACCGALTFAVYMIGVIFDRDNEVLRLIQFVFACTIGVILLGNALADGSVENALILGIIGVVTLVVAAISNSKRYVILSSIILVLLVFYLTRHIWASVAWWVYLFVAGVVLVGFAIKKETAENK